MRRVLAALAVLAALPVLAARATSGALAACAAGAQGGTQDSYLLVIVGLAGDAENAARFHQWAATLVDAAREGGGLAPDHVLYLGEDPARDPTRISGRSTRESIEAAVARVAAKARPGDQVFIVLIGHGAADGEPRISLPGPDLTAADFARLLSRFAAQTVAFVNTASASGGFVAPLAGPNRAIVTATRTDAERNQTRFAEFFVDAFAGQEADADKDGRVSLFEAFTYARQKVAQAYEADRQLLTEHAVLDDNGDGKGSDAPGEPGADGALARTLFLRAPEGGHGTEPEATADPVLRALYAERRALEDRIVALKAARAQMPAAQYDQQMEQLLIDLARKSREIREKEKK